MNTEQEPLSEADALPSPFEWSASYIAGLIGLAIGFGFYGVLCVLLLVAWAVHAPHPPSAAESTGIYRAALVHLFPLCLWLVYREQISRLPNLWRWALVVGAWGLIVATLTVMAACFGM
jgi:hypothetical protein